VTVGCRERPTRARGTIAYPGQGSQTSDRAPVRADLKGIWRWRCRHPSVAGIPWRGAPRRAIAQKVTDLRPWHRAGFARL